MLTAATANKPAGGLEGGRISSGVDGRRGSGARKTLVVVVAVAAVVGAVVVVLTVAKQMNWCLKRKSSGFKAPPIAGFMTSVNSLPMSLWPRSLVQASFNAAGPLGGCESEDCHCFVTPPPHTLRPTSSASPLHRSPTSR